jgi:hypothetical protein
MCTLLHHDDATSHRDGRTTPTPRQGLDLPAVGVLMGAGGSWVTTNTGR